MCSTGYEQSAQAPTAHLANTNAVHLVNSLIEAARFLTSSDLTASDHATNDALSLPCALQLQELAINSKLPHDHAPVPAIYSQTHTITLHRLCPTGHQGDTQLAHTVHH